LLERLGANHYAAKRPERRAVVHAMCSQNHRHLRRLFPASHEDKLPAPDWLHHKKRRHPAPLLREQLLKS
jgi:uncharacterized protein YqiB (DUF1249 family)